RAIVVSDPPVRVGRVFKRRGPQFHSVRRAQSHTGVFGYADQSADGLRVNLAVADHEAAQGISQRNSPDWIRHRASPVGENAIHGNPVVVHAAELRPIRACTGKSERDEQEPNATSSWDVA